MRFAPMHNYGKGEHDQGLQEVVRAAVEGHHGRWRSNTDARQRRQQGPRSCGKRKEVASSPCCGAAGEVKVDKERSKDGKQQRRSEVNAMRFGSSLEQWLAVRGRRKLKGTGSSCRRHVRQEKTREARGCVHQWRKLQATMQVRGWRGAERERYWKRGHVGLSLSFYRVRREKE